MATLAASPGAASPTCPSAGPSLDAAVEVMVGAVKHVSGPEVACGGAEPVQPVAASLLRVDDVLSGARGDSPSPAAAVAEA
eukprot:12122332-Alexandrium_andersonii.AAC.1